MLDEKYHETDKFNEGTHECIRQTEQTKGIARTRQ